SVRTALRTSSVMKFMPAATVTRETAVAAYCTLEPEPSSVDISECTDRPACSPSRSDTLAIAGSMPARISRSDTFWKAPYCASVAVTAVTVSEPSVGGVPSVRAEVAAGSAPHLRHGIAVPVLGPTVSVIASLSHGRSGISRHNVRLRQYLGCTTVS